jgi:hypothetical protein
MSEYQIEASPPAHSTTSLFTESGVKFLATYRVWIVAAVWLGVRGYMIWGLSPNYYVESYLKIAGDWLDGYTPYAAFKVEYPPGALLLFVLPRIFTEVPTLYGYFFAGVMLLADLVSCCSFGEFRRWSAEVRIKQIWCGVMRPLCCALRISCSRLFSDVCCFRPMI